MNQTEQTILRNYGRGGLWTVLDIITSPDTGIRRAKATMYGGSHLEVDSVAYWFATTAKGIELYRRDETGRSDGVVHFVRWTDVAKHAAAVPVDLRDRIMTLQKAHNKHQASWKGYHPTKKAIADREVNSRDLDRWDEKHAKPHYAKSREFEAQFEALLDEALPLSTGAGRASAQAATLAEVEAALDKAMA